jgi:hypothetical protein
VTNVAAEAGVSDGVGVTAEAPMAPVAGVAAFSSVTSSCYGCHDFCG